MCEVRPQVTLWGTSQITSVTTILSIIASGQVSTITRETIVTGVIPVQTRSYPCTSTSPTAPSPSPSTDPATFPSPEPQSQPSSEVPETTTSRFVSSLSPSSESSKSTGEATDSLTVELSPSRTLTTTTTRARSSSIVLQTVEPEPEATPTNDPLMTSNSDSIFSAASLSTDADHPDTTAGAAVSSSSPENTSLPVGAIVGIALAVLLVFSLLGFFIWTRKHKKDKEAEGYGDPYWERRFQELESVQSQSKPRLDDVQSPDDTEGTWRRHVSCRPCSRMIGLMYS